MLLDPRAAPALVHLLGFALDSKPCEFMAESVPRIKRILLAGVRDEAAAPFFLRELASEIVSSPSPLPPPPPPPTTASPSWGSPLVRLDGGAHSTSAALKRCAAGILAAALSGQPDAATEAPAAHLAVVPAQDAWPEIAAQLTAALAATSPMVGSAASEAVSGLLLAAFKRGKPDVEAAKEALVEGLLGALADSSPGRGESRRRAARCLSLVCRLAPGPAVKARMVACVGPLVDLLEAELVGPLQAGDHGGCSAPMAAAPSSMSPCSTLTGGGGADAECDREDALCPVLGALLALVTVQAARSALADAGGTAVVEKASRCGLPDVEKAASALLRYCKAFGHMHLNCMRRL